MDADNQQERILVTTELKWFLAGVIEGEGSVCVSIKKHPTCKFGFYADPEFFLYQHECGVKLLKLAQEVFGTGSIVPKCGNEHVLVYAITSRKSIYEKVIPFFEKYMRFSTKWQTYLRFKEIVLAMEEDKRHLTKEGLIWVMEKAYQMNPDSKGKERKRSLEEVKERILRGHMPDAVLKQ